MLDFYLIEDKQLKPNSPEEGGLVYIGGLGYKIFHRLKKKGVIEDRYDYFSDFRWDKKTIEQLCDTCELSNLDTDIKQFLVILNNALELKCGVIAYGD